MTKLAKEKEECECQLVRLNKHIYKQQEQYDIQLTREKASTESLKHKISELEAEISRKDASIEYMGIKLNARTKALEQKVTIITSLNEHLTRVREYLSSKKQVINNSTVTGHIRFHSSLLGYSDSNLKKF